LQLLNENFRTTAAPALAPPWALLQPIQQPRQIRTSAPGQQPRLKTPLTSLFFTASVGEAVKIKTDVNFPGTAAAHPR